MHNGLRDVIIGMLKNRSMTIQEMIPRAIRKGYAERSVGPTLTRMNSQGYVKKSAASKHADREWRLTAKARRSI
jgi:DNA-binding PadR family transcriptional regulator